MVSTSQASTLLPHVVQQNAQADPDGIFAQVPAGASYADGFRNITNLQLHHAVNYTAFLIKQNLGGSKTFETLAFIGASDPRYSIMVVAAIKTGYKIFLPSPRNSEEAHLSLLDRLQCTKLVVTEPQASCVPIILRKRKLQTMTLPSLSELLQVGDVEEYPYTKNYAAVKDDPIFVLHTSGSTGIPKPLIYTPEWIAKMFAMADPPAAQGFVDPSEYFMKGNFMCNLPPFHAAGIFFSLVFASYAAPVPVYTLPGVPPTTEAFVEAVSNADVDWALVPPVFIDELGKNPDLLNAVAPRLKHIFFAGGGAAKRSGDVVAKKLPLRQVLGSSEAGLIPLMDAQQDYDDENWNYMAFNPAHKFEMRHSHDNLYELVFVRDEGPAGAQAVFSMFPGTNEYHTKDLFKPHPSKEGFWLFNSRSDDVIVFLNGEKTNPLTFEEEVASHTEVRSALVVGAQRVEAALLIELATDKQLSNEEKTAFIGRIWPVIEKANKATPAHARIAKSKILLVDPNKPMLRAAKGTVQRNATLKLYAAEIDDLYQRDDTMDSSNTNGTGETDMKSIIRNVVAEMVEIDDLDLFQLGMDSLSVLKIRRALQQRFPTAKLTNNTVYSNATVNALAQAVQKLTAPTNGEKTSNGDHSSDELAKMLEEYTSEIDDIKPIPDIHGHNATREIKSVVLLTGSTGALGSYIFERLLSRTDVAHIYCFNRTADAKDRQIDNNRTRKLTTDFPSERVTFINGDLTKPSFGLSENDYQDLHEKVTHVVHNAWPVNFNLPLSSFRSSISGVVALIKFSAQNRQKSRIQFVSSISSVSSYPGDTVPEAVLTDLSTPSPMGYGQSKYISERLLDHACKTLGIRAGFVRLGQIAGAARTASGWNKQEWLPSLVASSAFIGALPETIGDVPPTEEERIDWVPADYLADILVELAFDNKHNEGNVSANHIVHPKPVLWSSLLQSISKAIEEATLSSQPIKVVSYADWVSTLKTKTSEAENEAGLDPAQLAQKNPAMKLLEFYESLAGSGEGALRQRLALEETMKGSKTLRELEPLKDEWVTGWVREWIELSGQAKAL